MHFSGDALDRMESGVPLRHTNFADFTGAESWKDTSPPRSRPISFARGSVVATGAPFQIGTRMPAAGLRGTAVQ